ncbi:MAG: toll/interleukin-1 receptor domain-containing protein [Lachnospiraceae bacterium]|nr:toll/interleukin-1 receptor domain-containing protein [Lachnospiraceae bacterium]
MRKIFISWSKSKSCDLAYVLKNFLESFDIETFISESDIIAGEEVHSKINDQIASCNELVICFTHENKKSPWLLYEAGLAHGMNKKTIPILFDKDPCWDSWIDNPMNYAREINMSSPNFVESFISGFELHDSTFIREAIKQFVLEVEEIKEKYRKIDIQCEEFVETLASDDAFQVKSPIYKNRTAYFLTGFETLELWKNIIESFLYTGKYLWIYGRKNMKLILHHEELFRYLDEKTVNTDMYGIDFRCLFLDPSSPEVKFAHKAQDIFFNELNSTIKRAAHLTGDNKLIKKCFRKYSHRRDEIIIRLDNCILYSKPHFDENGYPQIITNTMFEVFSATSKKGVECIKKFESVWDNAKDLF